MRRRDCRLRLWHIIAALSVAAGSAFSLPRLIPDQGSPVTTPCSDGVQASRAAPLSLSRAHEDAQAYGAEDVWFFVPTTARWGDLLERDGNEYRGKYAMWIDSGQLPQVSIRRAPSDPGKTGEASVSLTETTVGLPGPVPMGVVIPNSGCWRLTAIGQAATVSIDILAKEEPASGS